MDIRRPIFMSIFMFTAITSVKAEERSQSAVEATKQTQSDLRDPTRRQEILKNNPQGQQVDANLESLVMGNSSTKNEVYELSADLLDILMKQAGDDPAKLQEALVKIQSNPEAFVKSLPPEHRKKFDRIVHQVKTGRGVSSPKAP